MVDALSPFYVWTPDYAEKRLAWKRRHPLHVLLLRTYRIPRPVTVKVRKGWESDDVIPLLQRFEQIGVAAIAIHGVLEAPPPVGRAHEHAGVPEHDGGQIRERLDADLAVAHADRLQHAAVLMDHVVDGTHREQGLDG